MGFKLFLFIYSSKRDKNNTELMCQGYSVQTWSQGIASAWAPMAGITATKPLLTLYCQQCVPVAARHRGHQVWMCLLQLHWPRCPCLLVFPTQAAPGSFSPGAHLTICRGVTDTLLHTMLRANRPPFSPATPWATSKAPLWPQHEGAEESQGLLQPRTRGVQPHLLQWPQ